MTYCIGILVDEGLVMLADTRTNAGLDNIATFRKLHAFEKPGEATMAIATAGNLAVSQAVVSHLRAGLKETRDAAPEKLIEQPTMFDAAQLAGRAIRKVFHDDGHALEQHQASFDVTMLLGGQIKGQPPSLFMLYKAGNFIESTQDTPFLQIGEHKYGNPGPGGELRDERRGFAETRADLDGFDHALQSWRRTAARSRRPAARSDLLVRQETDRGG
jgi:putative proteasome-type protease